MAYRVIQCFSGAVGSAAIRLAVQDPRVEVVGLYVHHAEKEGRDAGELAGIAPIGVLATRDLDSLLDAGADCALWNGDWNGATVAKILRSGVNVYSGIHAYYLRAEPDFAAMQSACEAGGTTLAAGGNIPGLISDVTPLFLSGYTGHITQVRTWQRNHVPDLPSAHDLSVGVGFGRPCEGAADPTSPIDKGWEGALRQSAQMVADGLGVELEGFAISAKELMPAAQDMYLENSGLTIDKGSVAGVRWQFTGFVAGKPWYQMNVEMTIALGLAAGWRSTTEQPNWRIELDGTPNLVAEITVPAPVGPGILELNAARAVNSVSRVVEAPVGCRSILDFPAATGSGAFSPGASQTNEHRPSA
jgi:2,4-diaminopentanoate dehydrogenase